MIRMTILASTALAVAIAFSPAQAASVLGPGAQPGRGKSRAFDQNEAEGR